MGEIFFTPVLLFEEVYIKDEGRFGFKLDGVNFFESVLASQRMVCTFSLVKMDKGRYEQY